jgi:prepilin-type processing-associated H-X9-DG protein
MIKLRHTNTANILFCDGHAKALQPERIIETHPAGSRRVCFLWTIEED